MASTDFTPSPPSTMMDALRPFLSPEQQSPERARGRIPKDSISRSFFLMRTLVGVLGLGLPLILLLGDLFFLRADLAARGSLSAYYHSGMRDVFVGILCVVGILLFTYKVTERNRGNALSTVAGVSAVVVALFPTHLPAGLDETHLTPLQERLGEELVGTVHYVFAGIFIVSLAILCYDFAIRERERSQQRYGYRARFSPEFWYRFHFGATGLIVAAILFIVLTKSLGVFDRHSLLIGETVVTIAFGLSWLAKGMERDVLPELPFLPKLSSH
jgi:hypothetical protein